MKRTTAINNIFNICLPHRSREEEIFCLASALAWGVVGWFYTKALEEASGTEDPYETIP